MINHLLPMSTMAFGLILFAAQLSTSQVRPILRGTILDAETKLPIRYVNVRVIGTPYKAVTDSLGTYEIAGIPVGLQFIRFTHLAYSADSCAIMVPANRDTVLLSGRFHPRAILTDNVTVTRRKPDPIGDRFKRAYAQCYVDSKKIQEDAVVNSDDLLRRYAPFAEYGGFVLLVNDFHYDPNVLWAIPIREISEIFVWRGGDAPAEYSVYRGSRNRFRYVPEEKSLIWGLPRYTILIRTKSWNQ